MKFKKIWSGMAIAAVSFSGFVGVNAANAAPPEPTTTNAINDVGLKRFLNTEYFNRDANINITAADLEALTEIDIANSEKQISDYVDSSPGYVDISGLRYATNLKKIDFNRKKDDGTVADSNNFDLTDIDDEESANYFWNELNMIKSLEELDISRTQIEDPDNGIVLDLPNLTTITATQNSLSNLDYLSNLPNLTYLNLRNNNVDDSLAFLEGSPNLEELYLADNYGYTWDRDKEGTKQALSQLDNLKRLDLSYNGLTTASYEKYLIDSVMDMDSLEWFNFEGNNTRDLRPWKPAADKIAQTSFANQQLSSSSTKTMEADGRISYGLDFYNGTYEFNRAYDVDGIEYILREQGGLLYDSSGQSYDIEELKALNSDARLYYEFGNSSTRGSFTTQHAHFVFKYIGISPNRQRVIEEVGTAIQTQPLTVINSDATATYSTTDELPKGLTLDSETGVISGTAEEPFDGTITLIPTFSENVSYSGQNTVQITITGSINVVEPILSADLPNGKVGEEYNGSITVDSGRITAVNSLPDGLSYDYETGLVSGVPTEDSEWDVFIDVEKSGQEFYFIERVEIYPADTVEPPVEEEPVVESPVITTNLPDGKINENYEGSISAEPGEIVSVEGLPEGLSFDPDNGSVIGVPTVDGEFEVVINADNEGVETTLTETIVIEGIVEDDDTVVPGEDNQTPPVEDDETVIPDDDNQTPPGVNDDTDNVVPGDDTDNIVEDTETEDVETENTDSITVDEPVKPVDEPVKKVNSGELNENISSPVSYILFVITGFGLLIGAGFTRLRNKNN